MSGPRQPRVRVAVVITKDDSILLVQHRKGAQRYWLLPGGGLDFGETIAEAARRELWEETGLDIKIGGYLYLSEAIAPDGTRHMVQVTLKAELVDEAPFVIPDGDVIESVEWVPVSALAGLDLRPAMAGPLMRSHAEGFAHEMRFLETPWTP